MRTKSLVAAMMALAVVGCEAEPNAAPADSDTASVAEGDRLTRDEPSGTGETVGRSARELRTIPAQFLGVWDYIEGSCDSASDLRMEVGQRRIVFYESVGDVTSIKAENDNAVVVGMSMSGEGDSWTQSTRLTLEDGGDRLVPSDADGDAGYEPMPRKKCAA